MIQQIKKKADAYWLLKEIVHVKLNYGWKRGLILEIKQDYLILDERKEGKQIIFYNDIRDITKFHEVGQ